MPGMVTFGFIAILARADRFEEKARAEIVSSAGEDRNLRRLIRFKIRKGVSQGSRRVGINRVPALKPIDGDRAVRAKIRNRDRHAAIVQMKCS